MEHSPPGRDAFCPYRQWGLCFSDIYIPRDQVDLSPVGGLGVFPSVLICGRRSPEKGHGKASRLRRCSWPKRAPIDWRMIIMKLAALWKYTVTTSLLCVVPESCTREMCSCFITLFSPPSALMGSAIVRECLRLVDISEMIALASAGDAPFEKASVSE
jgi:hypothetical protein